MPSARSKKRPTEADLLDRITVNSRQCGGRPCIRGIRIRVIDVLELAAFGMTPRQIIKQYPYLEIEDVQACMLYAARYMDHPRLVA